MHSCTSCGKSFKFQSSLSRHMDIHKPEFRVHCSCGSSFTRLDSLKRHQINCTAINTNLNTLDDQCSTTEPEASKSLETSNKAERDVLISKPPATKEIIPE